MKIFITGCNGFIGREVVLQAKKCGFEVSGIDFGENNDVNFFKRDIRDKNISEIIPEGVDAILHLAALSRDPDCNGKAYQCFDINVMGTLNLIEAAEKIKAKQFIFASSEWVYDNCTGEEVKDEESIINIANHKSEYALSKLTSEANLRQKYEQGFCPVTILRFGIVYGPRKEGGSAVESLFNAVKTKEIIEVGSLKTGRCFVNVSDIVSGIIKSIGLGGFNIINLEGDKVITLGEIIEGSKKILNKNPKIIEKNSKDINIRNVSNKKAKKILGWEPKINLESGLKTIEPFI